MKSTTSMPDSSKTISEWLERPRIAESDAFFSILDGFPVSPGHALIISRRPVETALELTPAEFADLKTAIERTITWIAEHHAPNGYNIGMNCYAAAGQTVPHCHIHVIPRYRDDIPDPRGGVRNVIPRLGNYLLE